MLNGKSCKSAVEKVLCGMNHVSRSSWNESEIFVCKIFRTTDCVLCTCRTKSCCKLRFWPTNMSYQGYLPPSKRPDYADLRDIVLSKNAPGETNGPCVKINYDPLFKEVHDYFWALCREKAESTTERALDLTAEVIKANAANYTAWYGWGTQNQSWGTQNLAFWARPNCVFW